MKQTHWVTCGVQSESELYSALYCVNRLVWLWHSFKDVSHHNFLPLTSHEVLISQALTARELQKKTHTLLEAWQVTQYTWHRFPEAALNLTWNLNQEGRFLDDPWEGHSCVGTQWGRHASRPQRVAEATSLNGPNWGHPCLPWPEVYSWRMAMVSTVHWHDLMSRNLQHIYGCAAWLQSSDEGVVNKETGKAESPVAEEGLLQSFLKW